jgi:hypothetical protein
LAAAPAQAGWAGDQHQWGAPEAVAAPASFPYAVVVQIDNWGLARIYPGPLQEPHEGGGGGGGRGRGRRGGGGGGGWGGGAAAGAAPSGKGPGRGARGRRAGARRAPLGPRGAAGPFTVAAPGQAGRACEFTSAGRRQPPSPANASRLAASGAAAAGAAGAPPPAAPPPPPPSPLSDADSDAADRRRADLQAAGLLLAEAFAAGCAGGGAAAAALGGGAGLRRLLFEVFHDDPEGFRGYCEADVRFHGGWGGVGRGGWVGWG